jgi:hypothetical protein
MPEFYGAGVAYLGDGTCQVIRESVHASGLKTYIILEEQGPVAGGPAAAPPPSPAASRWRRLLPEVAGMGLNCTGAVLTGIATAGEAAAAPLTAGATAPLVWLTGAAAVATSAQCGLSIGRVINAAVDPGSNDLLDSEDWYQTTSTVLDAVAVAGAVASLGQAAQAAIRLQRASGRPFREILGGINRAERKRLAEDLARYSGQAQTRHQFLSLVREGRLPRVFNSQQVTQALRNQLLNSLSSALSLGTSASGGVVRRISVDVVQEQ